MVQPLWGTVWRFLKKLKIELPYDLGIPLLGIYPEKTLIRKDTRTTMFTAVLFTTVKTWKQPKCSSTDEWINKIWYIHTMEYYAALKRKEILTHTTTWMNLEDIRLMKQASHKRQILYDSSYRKYLG